MEQCVIEVKSSDTLESLIGNGKYVHVRSGFSKHFVRREQRNGRYLTRLISSKNDDWTPNVHALSMCQEDGFNCAGVEHILVLGARFPSLQSRFGIVALRDRFFREEPSYPFLGMIEGKRALLLHSASSDWLPRIRFMAVKRID